MEAQNNLRTVSIKDGIAIDPSQTSLPQKRHGLPTYLLKQTTPLIIETRKRGTENPAPDNLSLKRTIWLDEDGSHYTIKDEISGTMLAWGLWLAFSVLGWLRWGLRCFATDKLWQEVKPGKKQVARKV